MVNAVEIDRIDAALNANNELTSELFVRRLHSRLYGRTWEDGMRTELHALCSAIVPHFPIPMPKHMRSTAGFDSTGRSSAAVNADDAFRAARRNLIGAIVEYEERAEVNNPRSLMEILRDKRVGEQQLTALMRFTGYMGEELAREHVRTFERLVKAQIGAGVSASIAR